MQVKSRARNPGDFLIPAASPSHGPQRGGASGLLVPLPFPHRPPPPSPRQPPGGPSGGRGSPGGGGEAPPQVPPSPSGARVGAPRASWGCAALLGGAGGGGRDKGSRGWQGREGGEARWGTADAPLAPLPLPGKGGRKKK